MKLLAGPVGRTVFRGVMKGRATIFTIHRLEDPSLGVQGHSLQQVRLAIEALRESGAKLTSIRSLLEQARSPGGVEPDSVAFTMDDGFADQGTFVRQVFAPLHCPVTIFAIVGFLDGVLWPWEDQLAP